ncbi:hypothetical protein Q7P37_001885 [Cladosporium fusiforme]
MTRLAILALAIASANAFLLNKRDDADNALATVLDGCSPQWNETDTPDLNTPCNAYFAIVNKCLWNLDPGESGDEDTEEQPAETQRDCLCQSQHNDQVAGCMACYKAHGGLEGVHWYDMDIIESGMNEYCKADAEPENYYDMVDALLESETPATATESWTYSDPLADKTEVSRYYTASMTGSAALPAMPTPETSGGDISFASVKTSDGQIVPTASAGSGAMPTAMGYSGAAGAMGFAALVAVL